MAVFNSKISNVFRNAFRQPKTIKHLDHYSTIVPDLYCDSYNNEIFLSADLLLHAMHQFKVRLYAEQNYVIHQFKAPSFTCRAELCDAPG